MQYNLNVINANTPGDLVTKIGKERIKRNCKSPDTSWMHRVEIPSLRLCFYCSTLKRVANRIKLIKEAYPDREYVINKPLR